MTCVHDYGLSWIDQESLYDVTKKAFKNVVKPKKKRLPADPFTLISQAAIIGSNFEETMNLEALRSINKTLSNAIGLWHQHVLGLADGWNDTGSNGGVFDLYSDSEVVDPFLHQPMIAEVKNRFNTIKKSDEPKVWDALYDQARSRGATAYLIQIVPEKPKRYNKPWKVSERNEKKQVRCCDGASAYAMFFGVKDALSQLYEAFPALMADVLDRNVDLGEDAIAELYTQAFPQ